MRPLGLGKAPGLLIVAAALIAPAPAAADLSEGFAAGPPATWDSINLSNPLGEGFWRQGAEADTGFPAQAGGPNAYAGVDYQSVDGSGTISDWLITPPIEDISNGDTWSFYTRTIEDSDYPDRLQLRLSTEDCDPGTTATGRGDFSILLTEVNKNLNIGGYPESWTEFSGVIAGVPDPVTGCLGFRYFVTNGGFDGDNSNLIGLDTFAFTDESPPPAPPAITDTDPDSPAQDQHPEVKGTGVNDGDTVKLYATATCSGTAIGSGPGSAFSLG